MPDLQAEWLSFMRRGDYAGAWLINAAVLAGRVAGSHDDSRLPYHLRGVWDGRPFEGRDVLVRCYHGLGDTIQFARYLPVLRSFAASLSLECQPRLATLLSGLPGVDRLIPFDARSPAPAAECTFEIMELAFALRTPPEAVPPLHFRIPVAPLPPGTIGLCWDAGDWDRARSIPYGLFEPLTQAPCVTLVAAPTDLHVLNPDGCPRNMPATAALIAGADLVITVDTMIAHLAGTLGRPTWLLLKHEADWRWMADRADSPWYPSMRLYRQPTPGDWATVTRRVARDLRLRNAGRRVA